MVINISAVASVFSIEQVVTDSFPYQLTVQAGKAKCVVQLFTSHRLRLTRCSSEASFGQPVKSTHTAGFR